MCFVMTWDDLWQPSHPWLVGKHATIYRWLSLTHQPHMQKLSGQPVGTTKLSVPCCLQTEELARCLTIQTCFWSFFNVLLVCFALCSEYRHRALMVNNYDRSGFMMSFTTISSYEMWMLISVMVSGGFPATPGTQARRDVSLEGGVPFGNQLAEFGGEEWW